MACSCTDCRCRQQFLATVGQLACRVCDARLTATATCDRCLILDRCRLHCGCKDA